MKIELGKWSESINDIGAQQTLFGELLKLAYPRVQHYHSDFYHDALWIKRYVTGEMEFYYGVREYGTHIGTDAHLISAHNDVAYKVSVVREDRVWYVVIDEVPHED